MYSSPLALQPLSYPFFESSFELIGMIVVKFHGLAHKLSVAREFQIAQMMTAVAAPGSGVFFLTISSPLRNFDIQEKGEDLSLITQE
ncbi:unnamed protein product [Angiostrongylus costaricensis]|uniref:Proton_antipo_M domain-containing protein n=1 Tax=Angiostrongylus costaricensis TaxID=334426 RepID=A0A0R3PI96_ANGCS|nr:unnamed protein product [Angiostrongylus costaricensis]